MFVQPGSRMTSENFITRNRKVQADEQSHGLLQGSTGKKACEEYSAAPELTPCMDYTNITVHVKQHFSEDHQLRKVYHPARDALTSK